VLDIVGENSTCPTYDFTVAAQCYGSTLYESSTRFVGTGNGRKVGMLKEFPYQVNKASVPSALGETALKVTAGTGVTLVIHMISSVTGVSSSLPVSRPDANMADADLPEIVYVPRREVTASSLKSRERQ
jgi:hypothetical protein